MTGFVPYALVALGGALGSMARFAVATLAIRRFGPTFPHGTLIINLSGCFLIALFLSAATVRSGLDGGLKYLVPIGFVGAYTTFSTYEWEIAKLIEAGEHGPA